MERKLPVLTVAIILILFAAVSLVNVNATQNEAFAQPEATPSDCVAQADKSADPSSLALGSDTGVTLVVSGTCGSAAMPVDLVIVADESLSMTENRLLPPVPTDRPVPGTGTPTRDPPIFPTDQSGDPSFCPGGAPGRPSPTPTRRFQRRTPTPEPPTPTIVPEAGGRDDLIRASQEWVRDFVGQPVIERDFINGRLRMGFVSFNSRVVVKQPMSADSGDILSAAARLRGNDITRINVGMAEADRIMNGTGSREDPNRSKVIIVLSDFQVCQRDISSGGGNQRDQVKIVTVGMGRDYDHKKARDMASQPEYQLEQRDVPELIDIYERELTSLTGLSMAQMTVNDELMPNMELVPGSAQPPPSSINGQHLQWLLDAPLFPITFTYRVRPLEAGLLPVSAQAAADWTDTAGRAGSAPFPNVSVDVIPPTATPTATSIATATPTATALPPSRFFPIAYKHWPEAVPTPCVPEEQILDVALVIDTSTSMSDPTQTGGRAKLTVAIEAASDFVALLKPTDRAAIVGFNSAPTVASGLSSDKAALIAALQSLPATQATGTSIDLGLLTGLAELNKAAVPADTRSIVLVTDGRQTGPGGNPAVIAAADAAKAAGVHIVTVGLGSAEDVDEDLLRQVASSPDLYFPAPDAEDLLEIYRQIVDVIPCP